MHPTAHAYDNSPYAHPLSRRANFFFLSLERPSVSPFPRGPAAPSDAAPPPFRSRPRRLLGRGPAACSDAAPPPAQTRPRRPLRRGPAARYDAALPPAQTRPRRLLSRGPAARYDAVPPPCSAAAPPPATTRPCRLLRRSPAVPSDGPAAAPDGPAVPSDGPAVAPAGPAAAPDGFAVPSAGPAAETDGPLRRPFLTATPSPSDGPAAAPDGPRRLLYRLPPLQPDGPCRPLYRLRRCTRRPLPSPLPAPPLHPTAPPSPLLAPPLHPTAPPSPLQAPPLLQLAPPLPLPAPAAAPAGPAASSPGPAAPAAEPPAIDFDVWVDDLLLFLQCDRADGLSLFDLTSDASPAPAATEDATVRSQWATHDAAARLAVRRHLPPAERAHFGSYKSAQDLYFTLYYIVTRLPDSLRGVRNDLLAVCPTTLTVELLEKSLLAAEQSILAVGASRGDPRTPIFERCSPSTLLPSVASAATADLVGFESVGAASAPSGRRRSGKSKGAGAVVEAARAVEAAVRGSGGAAVVVGVEAEAAVAAATVGVAVVVARRGGVAPVVVSASSKQRGQETLSPQQLLEWYSARQRGGGAGPCTYVLRTGDRAGIGTAALGAVEAAAPGAGEAVALGASESESSCDGESALSGTMSAPPSLTFTLDSGASRSFFRDRTTLTPLSRPVAVSLADPSGGPNLARYSTDAGVDQFTPARRRVTHCTDADTGRHLTTFTRGPGSSMYTLTVPSPPPASGPVAASGWVTPPCLVSGAWSLAFSSLAFPGPSLPFLRGLAIPVTLHMDVWGPARVRGQGHERYFLLVVDDYSRYTTVFPLHSKGEVTEVLIDWIRAARPPAQAELRLGLSCFASALGTKAESSAPAFWEPTVGHEASARPSRFRTLHSRMGLLSAASALSWTSPVRPWCMRLPPHFLWPFAVPYAAHQINLHPRVSRPAMSPVLLWTGKVGDASAFRVWGSRFYHPSSRRGLSSQDVTFDESVPFYRLFPYCTPSLPPPPDLLVPVDAVDLVEVTGDSGAAAGAEPGGADSGGAVRGGAEPGGAATGGAEPGGAGPGGAEPGGAATGDAEPEDTVPGAAELGGAGSGAAEPGGAASGAAEPGVSPAAASRREPLSPQELREWLLAAGGVLLELELLRPSRGAGAAGPGAAGPAGTTAAGGG
ncbi:unnamed protein product [Closterium sp. NIES-64]|nr:unnamed protein product [Closterium sp. NIES-64]